MEVVSIVATSFVLFYLLNRADASLFVTFERVVTLDNYTCTGSSFVFHNESIYRTRVNCIASCLTYSTCHGIFYYVASQRWCRGCTEDVRQSLDNPDIVDANASTQFYLRPKPSTHGVSCGSEVTCDFNQYCAGTGICTCNPGLSYSQTMDTCDTECHVYGSTYEEHLMRRLRGYNMVSYYDISVQDCKDRCTAEPECRTFDYYHENNGCHLQASTAMTASGDFEVGICDHFHRNCE